MPRSEVRSSWRYAPRLALNALLVVPVAMALLIVGPRYLPAAEVAMFFLLELILTPLWMWLIFGEWPTREAFIGGLLILATLLAHSVWRLTQIDRDKSKSQPLHAGTA